MTLELRPEGKGEVSNTRQSRIPGPSRNNQRAETQRQKGAWRDSSGRRDRKYCERTSSHGPVLPRQEEGFGETFKQENNLI